MHVLCQPPSWLATPLAACNWSVGACRLHFSNGCRSCGAAPERVLAFPASPWSQGSRSDIHSGCNSMPCCTTGGSLPQLNSVCSERRACTALCPTCTCLVVSWHAHALFSCVLTVPAHTEAPQIEPARVPRVHHAALLHTASSKRPVYTHATERVFDHFHDTCYCAGNVTFLALDLLCTYLAPGAAVSRTHSNIARRCCSSIPRWRPPESGGRSLGGISEMVMAPHLGILRHRAP